MILYRLFLPAYDSKGLRWSERKMKDWIVKVYKLAGGITMISERVVGYYADEKGKLVMDCNNQVLIGTFPHVMKEIAELTKEHFDQSAVFYYVESKEAHLHV